MLPQSFFHWLDAGEGADLELPDVPRSKLASERLHVSSQQMALLVQPGCSGDGPRQKERRQGRTCGRPAALHTPLRVCTQSSNGPLPLFCSTAVATSGTPQRRRWAMAACCAT